MAGFFKTSDAASIALHAVVYISIHPEKLVRIKEIAENFDISEAHLAKVLNRLVKTGLITATRGPSGGYKLGKSPDDISLKEIYSAIEGDTSANKCMFGIGICNGSGCSIGDFFDGISKDVETTLSKTKLSNVLLHQKN
jgi:Rrf2 family protein